MQVTWVIERHIFEEEQELNLIEEVKKQGGETLLIDPLNKHNFDWEHSYFDDRPVVFKGSLNMGKKARNQAWYPGVICHPKNFNCSTYYTYWGKWMLNEEYLLLPLAEVERRQTWLSGYFIGTEAFIRPDSGMKQFTGGIHNFYDLDKYKDLSPETLVLVAPIKQVDREYRFVICDNKVITGCQYYEKGEYVKQNTSLSNMTFIASCYLKRVLHDITWQPDTIYTVDVCESEGEFSILELNSFSCSALYSCDLSKVVEAANKVAIREWKEINDN